MIFVLLKFNVTFFSFKQFCSYYQNIIQFSECNNISIISEECGFRFARVASCEQDNQHTRAKAED
jgi:hypothetical protein